MFAVFVTAIFSSFGLTNMALAAGYSSTAQFGGRITSTTTPPVICNSQYGALTVTPAKGSKISGPFVITGTSKDVNSGGQIIGLYDTTVDMKTCYIQLGPYRINVPTYKVKANTFNTSKR